MNAPTDEQLLHEYLDGQASSFELLVRRHAPELQSFVLRFTGDFVAAEDVVQETFLQVHNSADSFDPTRPRPPTVNWSASFETPRRGLATARPRPVSSNRV